MRDRWKQWGREVISPMVKWGLFASAGTALVNVAAQMQAGSVSRARDLGIVLWIRRILELFDLQTMSTLPSFANRPFDLTSAASSIAFLSVAVITSAICYLGLIIAATPWALLGHQLARWLLPATTRPRLWNTAFPLATATLLFLPLFSPLVHSRFEGRRAMTVVLTLLVAALLWGLLLLVCRRETVVEAVTRHAGTIGAVVLAAAILLGTTTSWWLQRKAETSLALLPPNPPSVLLVSIDTLRPDHLHCYGYDRETSPNIDSVAREGALFRTVVSSSTWTLPAHLTLLTGLPSEGHGVAVDGRRLSSDALLLSEVLREAGYDTAGFVAGPYLSGTYGFLQGFNEYDDFTVARLSNRTAHHEVTSPASIKAAKDWLERWDRKGRRRPFFLFLHMWDPHYDFVPPSPYDTMFDPEYSGTMTGRDFEKGDHVHPLMDPRDLEHLISLYDGEIRFTDHHLGRLFHWLEEAGLYDDLLLLITSDHGEEFFEHGKKGHRNNLYDETLLVPLIMRFPRKIPAGITVDRQVRLMDIAPTILSLVGVERPESFGGESSVPYRAADLTAIVQSEPEPSGEELPGFGDLYGNLKAIRLPYAKLVLDLSTPSNPELYDLEEDPLESSNLKLGAPGLLDPLDEALGVWQEAWARAQSLSTETSIDEELEEQLRALGYID